MHLGFVHRIHPLSFWAGAEGPFGLADALKNVFVLYGFGGGSSAPLS